MVLVHETGGFKTGSCQVTERKRNSIANDQREITPKIYKSVMVLMHDTSSYCALQLYEVSFE